MVSCSERYGPLRDALHAWSVLWGNSVFRSFPEMERLVPGSWFEFGATASLPAQFELGQGARVANAPPELVDWIARLRELCAFPRQTDLPELPTPYDRDLTPKKKHEIRAVLGVLQDYAPEASAFLDIGGGAGHLARSLAKAFDRPVVSVDRNRALQEKGRRIQARWPWKKTLAHPVRFVEGEFPRVELPQNAGWVVGLHTCGGLAWSVLELAQGGHSLLSVGCCYDKLDSDGDLQRSACARSLPLPWTREALFLANRGGVERTLEEFLFQQRMQRFRFTLHELLLREGRPVDEAEAVGSARESIYRGAFADYVRDRSRLAVSDRAAQEFFEEVAPRIERKRFIAFLRNLLARPLEVAILLDRAAMLAEKTGREARLLELFDPKLSPRNLGILFAQ